MSEEEDITDKLQEDKHDKEKEILEELIGIDDPDEFREKKKDIDQKVQQESELLDILHKKAQNANKENALFFEGLKKKLTEEGKQLVDSSGDEDIEERLSDYINRMVSVQLVIDVLKEGPSFNDIAMRLDKIEEFIDIPDEESDDIVSDFEGGDISFD